MTAPTLTKLLKEVYPYFKEGSGLPPWLLPESSINQTADEVGDSGLMHMSGVLGQAEGMPPLMKGTANLATASPQVWQEGVRQWPHLAHVGSVVTAFLEIADTVVARLQFIRLEIDPTIICRSLAVLLFAPFNDQGKPLVEEIASVLGNDAHQPDKLIKGYGEAVARGDITTLERVNGCIVRYDHWRRWASALQEQVLRCRHAPKLIAVTPPHSADVISLLAIMMKEGKDES